MRYQLKQHDKGWGVYDKTHNKFVSKFYKYISSAIMKLNELLDVSR